jgi:hypothetical protein
VHSKITSKPTYVKYVGVLLTIRSYVTFPAPPFFSCYREHGNGTAGQSAKDGTAEKRSLCYTVYYLCVPCTETSVMYTIRPLSITRCKKFLWQKKKHIWTMQVSITLHNVRRVVCGYSCNSKSKGEIFPVHAMQAYMGSRAIALFILNLRYRNR